MNVEGEYIGHRILPTFQDPTQTENSLRTFFIIFLKRFCIEN